MTRAKKIVRALPAGMPATADLKKTAVDAALAAGKVLIKHFGRPLDIREKKNAGLVTNADVEAEQAALKILRKRYPDFGILTEESPEEFSKDPGRWIMDPLDGTTNFVHRFPMFCVSIAAQWANEVVVGVIYHPILNDLYIGVRGKGATVNGKKLQVSKTSRVADSLLTTGFTYKKKSQLRTEMDAFERLSGIARAVRRPGSAALDLAYTARGVFDGFWERNLSAWDTAAGALLVEEAGGKVTNFEGHPFRPEMKQILATNGALYTTLQQTIAPEFCQLPGHSPV
ncbi:MAG: inositol monophosphatase family protein [Oligoflexia bacterium]|nr:inositol monophosphatase family protein [Oligoflexia bacterium]